MTSRGRKLAVAQARQVPDDPLSRGAGRGLRILVRSARARQCFRGVFIRVRLLHPCAKWLRRQDGWAELRTRMQEAHTDDTSGGGMQAGAREPYPALRGDEFGTVEVGKLADLLIVEGDVAKNIALLSDRSKFLAVMQAGVIKAGRLA